MSKYFAWGLSFFIGAGVMILELTASRVIAPILGNSLYTWTAVIGVVLAGLSLGAYLGGRVIDRFPKPGILRALLHTSGAAVCLMMLLSQSIAIITLLPLSVPILATLISAVLFFVPATLLGAVQPMVVKLSSHQLEHLGGSYGTLSALWSLGSIVGVFLSGFYLIPLLGTWKTFLLVAIILFSAGIMMGRTRAFPIFFLAVLLMPVWYFSRPLGEHVLFSKDTGYFKALVAEANFAPFGESRILFLDLDTHSIARGTSTAPLYTDIVRMLSPHLSASSSILVIGGGAYTMPNDLAERTKATVDVFEIDPEIPGIVRTYFSIHPKVVTLIGDARQLLSSRERAYDLIVGDSFSSFLSVPWHLLTQEWNTEVRKHLNERGIYVVNIISTVDGEGSDLYEAVDKTLRGSFPFVEAYGFGSHPSEIQNIVFLTSLAPQKDILGDAPLSAIIPGSPLMFEDQRIMTVPIAGMLLTDDHAPTDTFLLPIAKHAIPSSSRLYLSLTR